jgi:hypothetical protein
MSLLIDLINLKTNNMEYKIISSRSPEELTRKVNEQLNEGWKLVGGHSVVEIHRQNRYSGMQHMDTRIEVEYSQSIVREVKLNTIEVDVAFYHPNDDETIKVYDEEGMREEFEYKLSNLIKQN